jgi:peptidoglycan/xylan/chitin deacetylase (PgdA/CDA1 family)
VTLPRLVRHLTGLEPLPRLLRRRAAFGAGVVLLVGSLGGCVGFQAHADTNRAAAVAPDCLRDKCVALTFDDGPGAYTAQLLDLLASKDVKATFFVLGKQVKLHPDLVGRAVAEGHQIGDHTWDHKVLTSLPEAGVLRQVNRTADEIEAAAGIRPDVMRPPSGLINPTVANLVGMPAVLWSIDTRDWQHRDATRTVEAVREGVKPGSVVLMHDIYSSSIDAVPQIIDELRADGYAFVTVRDMFGGRLQPGQIVHGGEEAFEQAIVDAAQAEEAREVEEYLRNDGQPETGAVPGAIVPRSGLPAAAEPEA